MLDDVIGYSGSNLNSMLSLVTQPVARLLSNVPPSEVTPLRRWLMARPSAAVWLACCECGISVYRSVMSTSSNWNVQLLMSCAYVEARMPMTYGRRLSRRWTAEPGKTAMKTCCHSNGYNSDRTEWTHDVSVLQSTISHQSGWSLTALSTQFRSYRTFKVR